MDTIERLPPHSIEAEEAVLGSLLIDPDALFEVSTFLRPDFFYREQNKWIYQSILDLHDRREPVDLITLTEELRRREQLEELGGEAYVIGLINIVPTSINAKHYGKIVEATALRRRLIAAATQIATLAYDENEDVNVVIDRSEQTLFSVSEERVTRDLTPVKQIAKTYLERIEELNARGQEIIGVPTGFTDMDRMLGGLNKSDLIIVAARPGMGKTSLQMSMAMTAALKHQKRVAVFSLEMSGEQLLQRMIAIETRIDSQRLRRGNLYDHEWPIFYEAIGRLSETQVFIDDTPGITPMQLRTKCRRLYAEHGIDMVLIDYLQLMQTDFTTNNRVQEISEISRSLKGLARELDVPVVAAAQLSRAVEQRQDKHPMLSDLRDSGCLTGDTLVTLADSGQRIPICELEDQSNFAVWALNPDNYKIERALVSKAFTTGVKPVYRLTTALGRTIRATGNHKFLTIQGWKRLDEIESGVHLALPRQLKNKNADYAQTMSLDELALLGHLIGDGYTLPRHVIQYTSREEDLAYLVAQFAKQVFGEALEPKVKLERRWFQTYLTSTRHHTHGVRNPISVWLDGLGVWGLRSHEKFVPQRVFQQPTSAIAHFLKHLWATDGCIRMTWGKSPRPAIYYASSSFRLAQDVQSLLLRLGINARLTTISQQEKGRPQYHVILSGREDISRFGQLVGPLGQYKCDSWREIETHLQERKANTNRDVLPKEVWAAHVRPAMAEIGMSHRQLHAAIGTAYSGMAIFNQNVSRERAMRVAAATQSTALHTLAQSDIYWDQVISIEADGVEAVYDLTVPGPHNFIANDIIVHNSIEQDADIVMFIYRDDYYYPETSERKNIAEINVAKHRNGPTGAVDLFWHGELATFRNLQRQEVQL